MTRASNRLWQSGGSDYNLAIRTANAEFSLNHPAVCREGRALNIPHPIPYQGSKRHLARHILRFFPGNLARLVEPFAGSAAVSLAAAALGKAREFWINDINQPLMELWDRIINDPESISRNYEDIWTKQSAKEREYYDLIRREFNKTQHPDLLLFLLARCVKASVRYNFNHEFNQSPDNRRRGRKPDNMRMDILRASLLLLKKIKGKQAKIVVDHILKNGFITTEDLKNYGYEHPPRAVRDVIDQGIPIEKFNVKDSHGKTIAAYRFGNLAEIKPGRSGGEPDKLGGRKPIPKKFKEELYKKSAGRCSVCSGTFDPRYLQIDHRIPYEISGNILAQNPEDFMLICRSCNRAKSWSCEHCGNWNAEKKASVCTRCYWASPENYTHIALEPMWSKGEVKLYNKLRKAAKRSETEIPDYVKRLIKKHLKP